jgi:hypothetical protein|tara:strand:- start:206 stop:628 length:423 start_codon:yes stop_codon:yes gene_type:complete
MIKDLFLYPHREKTESLLDVHAKGCTENESTLRTILVFETNYLESVQTPSFFFEMNDIRLEIAKMGNDIFTIEKPTPVTGKPNWVSEFFTTRFWVWFKDNFLKTLEPSIRTYDSDINVSVFSNQCKFSPIWFHDVGVGYY